MPFSEGLCGLCQASNSFWVWGRRERGAGGQIAPEYASALVSTFDD